MKNKNKSLYRSATLLMFIVSLVVATGQARADTETLIFSEGQVSSIWPELGGIDQAIGFDVCVNDQGDACPSISWQFVTDADRGNVLEVTHSGEQTAYIFFRNQQGVDLNEFADGFVSLDIRVSDYPAGHNGFSFSADCVFPCTSGDNPTGQIGLTGWEKFVFPVSSLTASGLNLSQVDIPFKLFPSGPADGLVYLLDNIKWSTTSPLIDADNDGFFDAEDSFPNDPAASVDTDGDGSPDNWNPDATSDQIAASTLTLDAFPDDKFESVDSDSDGIGANVDVDDNDSSVGYQSFASALAGISDPALQACLQNQYPSATSIADVGDIYCDSPESDADRINNIQGVDAFKLIQSFYISGGGFSDLTPLAPLVRLTSLYMANGDSGLAYGDVGPLVSLTSLQNVSLDHWQFDQTAVEAWVDLEWLTMNYTSLTAIPDLSNNTKLRTLALQDGQLADLSNLSTTPNLLNLYLSGNAITDITPIAQLSSIPLVYLSYNPISDLSALSGLSNLLHLDLTGTQITDLAPLSSLDSLQYLVIQETAVTSLEPVAAMGSLETLYASNTQISDLSPLSNKTSLRVLHIGSTTPQSFEPISSLVGLTSLAANATAMTDAGFLSALTNIEVLSLDDNYLTDISWVTELSELNSLDLTNNQIAALNGNLANMQSGQVYLNGNPLSCNELEAARLNNKIFIDFSDTCASDQVTVSLYPLSSTSYSVGLYLTEPTVASSLNLSVLVTEGATFSEIYPTLDGWESSASTGTACSVTSEAPGECQAYFNSLGLEATTSTALEASYLITFTLEVSGNDELLRSLNLTLDGTSYSQDLNLALTQGIQDEDEDGIPDPEDAFPSDPAASVDSDGDGYPDFWNPDVSADQLAATDLLIDAFPNDPAAGTDTDGDGHPDFWNPDASADQLAATDLSIDAFPNDPAASVDTDGDGYPDSWNPDVSADQLVATDLLIDAFPNDPAAGIDTDGDGQPDDWNANASQDQINASTLNVDGDDDNDGVGDPTELTQGTDPLNPDTDGDGVADGGDLFPLDSSEYADSDGDGVGDIADNDDDNDNIDDASDLFPRSDFNTSIIVTDLTETAMPFGIVTYAASAVADPEIWLGIGAPSWRLQGDGTFRTTAQPSMGQWNQFAGGYQLISDDLYPRTDVIRASEMQNLNWSSDAVADGNLIELTEQFEQRFAVIEQGDEFWRIASWAEIREYAADTSMVLDPTLPVRTISPTDVKELVILAPTATFEPFTPAELIGSWAMGTVNQIDTGIVEYCFTETSSCSDIITFNADNTGFAEASGRSLTWAIMADGSVELTFTDTGTKVDIRRWRSAADTSTALISLDSSNIFVNGLQMIVKRSAPAPTDVSGLLGGVLSSGFYVTSTSDDYAHRSSIDGQLIDNFAFVLNPDGSGQRIAVSNGYSQVRELTWSQTDSRITSYTCFTSQNIDGVDQCVAQQVRSWDLIGITADRLYVHETLAFENDYDQDGVMMLQSSTSRNNFYELSPYYDLNDFDRDGYPNDSDAFPTDETEWLDSDDDGLGDNSDPDADIDGDGINNGEDSDDDNDGLSDDDELTIGTSPFNFDSDGDGTPDGSDSFPLDASEQLDSDADGIGNTVDPDDDNDGIADDADLFPLSDYQRPFIAADLTSDTMPLGIVQFPRGAIEQPPIYYSQVGRAVEFSSDGSFITNKQPLQQLLDANFSIAENNVRLQGTWSPLGSGYQTQPAPVGQVQDVFCSQGTADYLASFSNLARPIDCQGVLDFSVEASFSLALVDQGETTWTIAYEETVSLYAVDESLVLDPNMPVKTEVSGVQEIEILAPDVETIPFTASELLGTWSVAGIASDAPDLAEQCQFGGRIDCDDLMQVNADGTVFLQQSGRSGTWTLLPDGGVEVVFADTGAVASIRRLDQAPGISTMVLSVGGSPDYYLADVDIMIKQASPPPAGVDPFFGQFLTNGFTLASDDEPRSTIDNGYIGAFGFVINADGSASRNLASSYYDVIDGVTVRQGYAFAEINTWQLDGDTITFEYCSQVGEDPCGYQKNRTWKLLDVLENRILIHERLTYRRDRNSDGVFTDDELVVDISRPNFYEPLPYYDANDVDRDGYPNDSDAFPTDELEWIDSDGDGIGDNSDPNEDPDNDGFLNIDDAFPQDPAASVDSDGDGAPDYWNDNATEQQIADSNLVLDQLPSNSEETVDTDGDGTGNNADSDDDNDGVSDEDELATGTDPLAIDSDGDGSPDGFDSFPLDSSEQRDADGDGTGDIADNDDDNDGIEDGADLFPFHALDKAIIATDLTETAMPFGIVTYLRGLVDDPALRQGVGWPSWKLQGDGSYRTSDRNASSGQWSELGGGYVLVGDLGDPIYAGLYGDVQNINWDSDAVDLNMQIETRRRNEYRLAVVETGQQTWRVAIFQRGAEYATDTSVLIDPTQPVRVSTGQSVYEIEILAPTTEFMPFTSAEVLGAWTFDYLNSDDVTLAEHCLESDRSCSDIVRFNADGTAFTELSNRSATWLLNAAGAIELSFVDSGTMMILRRFAQGADTSVTLVGFETADRFASDLRMMVKRSAPSPQDISGFLGSFLSSSFYVTNDDDGYGRRSSIDGGYIENFGLLLNEEGTGVRASVADIGFSRRDLTWVQNESRLESDVCFVEFEIDGEPVCVYTQHRDWDLIKVTDTRIYVHETLSVTEDYDQDGVPTVRYSLSRPNFYEITPYYDVNDFDRDGYPNDVDAFPTIETEWLDSDGDGIGDNSDPDADPDGDGIPNSSDAFPQQAVASVDTDGDGAPDSWNADATEQEIQASGLMLDAFPTDASETSDTDMDGVGDNADAFPNDSSETVDSDMDGVGDNADVFPNDPEESVDSDSDGVGDNADAFPTDPNEVSDFDGDFIGDVADTDDDNDTLSDEDELAIGTDPYNVDSDGDGVADGYDAFPLDSSEQDDTDGDGFGDFVDTDDDNDGIEDGLDIFPYNAMDTDLIDADLTETSMPVGIVPYQAGAVDDPAIWLGGGFASYTLAGDGSYRTLDRNYAAGQWQSIEGGYRLTSNESNWYLSIDPRSSFRNIDWTYDGLNSGQWEVRGVQVETLAVIEQTASIWRLARSVRLEVYAVDPSITLNPTKPILINHGFTEQLEVLPPETSFGSFVASDLIGTWALEDLNKDDITLTTHCNVDDFQCGDMIQFNADNTASTLLSNRSATWTLSPEGYVEIAFADNGTVLVLRPLVQADETTVALVTFTNTESYMNSLRMMVKRDDPAPNDVSNFLGTFLSSSFYITADNPSYARRSSVDGGLIDNFGFVLRDDGTGERVSVRSAFVDPDTGAITGGNVQRYPMTWTQADDQLVSEVCLYAIDPEGLQCYYAQRRTWDLVKVTDTRLYVFETIERGYAPNLDGQFEFDSSLGRPNFYELTPYYDVDDVDRDGVANDLDLFPAFETEWLDSDGDLIGDNSDPDADPDGDGVPNSADAFPQSAAASVDTDGDGAPDEWNASASEQDIADSGLTLDAFPADDSETTDSDMDGVGDNADAFPNDSSETVDSDMDGVGDNSDVFPNNPEESADSDSDGVGDNADAFPNDSSETVDSDMDGVGDNADVFPNDPEESFDSDSDGVGDNADAFPNDSSETVDSDMDGVGDNADVFPNDPEESVDSDSDGVGDNGDAFPDDPNESVDADGDGVGANSDPDDNDALIGVPNPDAILTLSDAEATLGSSVTVMMSVSDVQALNALDASISYDSAYLQLDSVSVAETLAGWNLDWFSPAPGSVNVSMFTLDELSGPADMVALQFTLIAGSELPIPVRLTSLVLNDGQLVPAADHGSVTETFFYDVSGRVSYWGDSAVAMPATIILDNEVEAGTDASGVYSFADVQIGDHRLDIQVDQEDNRAIRAFDASLALNIAVGAIEPGPLKFMAADVNASGTVNSSDARSILRYVVGLDSLPFAGQDSIWVTEPGGYEFAPLDSNVSDADFVGVLVGDVSGNWQPATDAAKSARVDAMSASGPVTTMVEANADGTFTVTLSLNEARDLSGLDFELSTSSGVTLLSDSVEVLMDSNWSPLVSQSGSVISFAAFTLSASPVQDIVRMTLSVSDDQQMLESILLFLDEESHEQSLAIALAVDTTDTDEDGLTDLEEAELGTDPELADSDSDGISDGEEVEFGTNPLASDTDGDGYSDGEEVLEGTSPLDADDQPLPESKVWLYQLLIETARERQAAQP